MRKLIPFNENQNKYFKDIYINKRTTLKNIDTNEERTISEIIDAIKDEVSVAYLNYNECCCSLECVEQSFCNDIQKKALIHCYDKSTNGLTTLKGKIKQNQPNYVGNLCQFCGINSANTFDHYIPKSEHPEFSVYGPNLIPCCSECNSLKGNEWKGEQRYFINLYYDNIPEEAILEATVIVEDEIPIVTFDFKKQNNDILIINTLENSSVIGNHYSRLRLPKRFKENCNNYLYEIIRSLEIRCKITRESILCHLEEEYLVMKEQYGVNHWKTVLVEGLLRSPNFIELCIKE